MRFGIIKAFLPWLVFFAFPHGDLASLRVSVIAAIIVSVLFNRVPLKKKLFFDWASLIVFFVFLIFGVFANNILLIKYAIFIGFSALALICLFSVLINRPFATQHAKFYVLENFWNNPIFTISTKLVSFFAGLVFLCASILTGLHYFAGVGSFSLMIHKIPAYAFILVFAIIVVFPDLYKSFFSVKGTVSGIKGISDIKTIKITDKISIAIRTVGKGPMIMLLPGLQMNMHMWDPELVAKLSENYKVLLLDYPGVGQSKLEDKKFKFDSENVASLIRKLIQELPEKPEAILGYSMGGFVAQALIEKDSNITKALVLIGTDFGGKNKISCEESVVTSMKAISELEDTPEKLDLFLKLLFPKNIIAKMRLKMIKIIFAAAKEGKVSKEILHKEVALIYSWAEENSHEKNLAKITNPVLLVGGTYDIMVPYKNVGLMHKLYKNSKIAEFDNAGHGLIYQYPIEIAARIKTFLQGK